MKLHPTTVVFDDVSDVVVARGSTFFNFVSRGEHQYSVQILGWPRIRKGMKVTALLEEPGNWQTLKGWIDQESGQIVGVTQPQAALGGLLFFLVLFLLFSGLAIADGVRGINDHYLFAYFSAITGLGVVGLLVHLREARQLTNTLKSLREQP